MRLIDADELEHMLRTDFDTLYETIFDTIRRVPTIDAVPIVQCKDCKYKDLILCPLLNLNEDEDFCSLGERKDNDRA